ncbi:hypothetical protein SDC9_146666 [bioreactor metagenome]|uniref:Uncharacterized protein n=1 Tax=bioreactor metagenome TaxID=1076179 RepID=A0A645EDA7_9ZZZZ
MDGDIVRPAVQLVYFLYHVDVAVQSQGGIHGEIGIVAVDIHSKGQGDIGNQSPHRAQTHDAQRLAVQLGAGIGGLAFFHHGGHIRTRLVLSVYPVGGALHVPGGDQHGTPPLDQSDAGKCSGKRRPFRADESLAARRHGLKTALIAPQRQLLCGASETLFRRIVFIEGQDLFPKQRVEHLFRSSGSDRRNRRRNLLLPHMNQRPRRLRQAGGVEDIAGFADQPQPGDPLRRPARMPRPVEKIPVEIDGKGVGGLRHVSAQEEKRSRPFRKQPQRSVGHIEKAQLALRRVQFIDGPGVIETAEHRMPL